MCVCVCLCLKFLPLCTWEWRTGARMAGTAGPPLQGYTCVCEFSGFPNFPSLSVNCIEGFGLHFLSHCPSTWRIRRERERTREVTLDSECEGQKVLTGSCDSSNGPFYCSLGPSGVRLLGTSPWPNNAYSLIQWPLQVEEEEKAHLSLSLSLSLAWQAKSSPSHSSVCFTSCLYFSTH